VAENFASASPSPDPQAGRRDLGDPQGRSSPPADSPSFEIVLRGYDRVAVDAFVNQVATERAAMRRELEISEQRRRVAEQQAAATERENRTLRAEYPAATPTEDGFGFRAEKLMRLAKQEAGDVRATAARDAAALREQGRTQAEQYRHEVEQNLIARSTRLDQQASRRAAELREREQALADQAAAARAETDALRAATDRAAEQRRAQVEAEADVVRTRLAHEARRVLELARQEADRLAAVQGGVRADLARLVNLLVTELNGSVRDTGPGTDRSGLPAQRPPGPYVDMPAVTTGTTGTDRGGPQALSDTSRPGEHYSFAGQASDHDPQTAQITLRGPG